MILRNPARYNAYNEYSKYLTGHDLLVGDRVNNIRSYYNLFPFATSFRDIFFSWITRRI